MFKAPILVAYPYMTKSMTNCLHKNESSIRFVLDSGAFTAWKAGKTIDVKDYIAFIKALPFEPWRYFALDVIGDPHGTMRNYKTMLAAGLNPIPIFTRGENISVLDDYYKTSDVVGIGGLVGTPGNTGFVKGIMRHVGDRKVHWLGFTNLDFIKHYRPYMCDSSSWEMGARYARFSVYCCDGVMRSVGKTTIKRDIQNPLILDGIRRLGFDPHLLLKKVSWVGVLSQSRLIGGASWIKLSDELTKNLGSNLFLAAASDYAIEKILLRAHERLFK